MAGNCFRRFWWWLPIAILSGCFLRAVEAGRISCTSTYPSETARGERPRFGADVIIFLGERCDGEINTTEIQDHLERAPDLTGELSVSVIPRSREYIRYLRSMILFIQQRRGAGVAEKPSCVCGANFIRGARLENYVLDILCDYAEARGAETGKRFKARERTLKIYKRSMTRQLIIQGDSCTAGWDKPETRRAPRRIVISNILINTRVIISLTR